MKNTKVKVSDFDPSQESLDKIHNASVNKMYWYISKGYTKQQLYLKFPNAFVDKNYPCIENKPKDCFAWCLKGSKTVQCNTIPCCGFMNNYHPHKSFLK